jgi:hypothetical protein
MCWCLRERERDSLFLCDRWIEREIRRKKLCASVYMCVCVRERRVGKCLGMRERERMCVCVCVLMRERERKREYLRVCVCVCVYERKRKKERERERQTDGQRCPQYPQCLFRCFCFTLSCSV